MVYSSRFLQVRAIGTLGNNTTGVEQWQVGFKIPLGPSPSEASILAFLQTIAPAVSTFHADSGNGFGSTAFLKELTGAFIDVDGKYVGGGAQSTVHHVYTTPVAGSGTGVLPFSTAIVLSLRTINSRGPASNGRMYWPKLAVAVSPTLGTWSIGEGAAMATKAATMLDNVNAAADTILGTENVVSVMSQVGPTYAPVTSVRVGHKPDRQERREKSISESYGAADLGSTRRLLEELRMRRIGDA